MKYLSPFLAMFLLVGCSQPAAPNAEETDAPQVIETTDAGGQVIAPENLAQMGETCGPDTDMICASGLSCQFEGNAQTDGVCLPVVVNPDIECDETQAPVCGLIGSNKNGYLNECYARRYGATILNEGFCTTDDSVRENCEAPARSIGNCQQRFTGAVFSDATNECETVAMMGCNAEIPFETLEACQNRCES